MNKDLPAYPTVHAANANGDAYQYAEPGLNQRDYTAIQAMNGILSNATTTNVSMQTIATAAYAMADAMIAESNARPT